MQLNLMLSKRIYIQCLCLLLSGVFAATAHATPSFSLDPARGFVGSPLVVPTGSIIRFRFINAKNLPDTLSLAVTGIKDLEPVPLKEGPAIWKLVGAEQQEQAVLLKSQRVRIIVGNFIPKKPASPAKVIRWGAEQCTKHGDTFDCIYREPVAQSSTSGELQIELKVIPPAF